MNLKTYDNYIYRLSSTSPVFTIDLPKDVIWTNETQWSPVSQTVEWSTTGALLMQEGVKLKGREIFLEGKDNMAWIDRPTGEYLMNMRDTQGLVMIFEFVDRNSDLNVLFSHSVMFYHAAGESLVLENIKDFDQYEPDAWYIIRSIKLIEVVSS